MIVRVEPRPRVRLVHAIDEDEPRTRFEELTDRLVHVERASDADHVRSRHLRSGGRQTRGELLRRRDHAERRHLAIALGRFEQNEAVALELDDDDLARVLDEEGEDLGKELDVGLAGHERVLVTNCALAQPDHVGEAVARPHLDASAEMVLARRTSKKRTPNLSRVAVSSRWVLAMPRMEREGLSLTASRPRRSVWTTGRPMWVAIWWPSASPSEPDWMSSSRSGSSG